MSVFSVTGVANLQKLKHAALNLQISILDNAWWWRDTSLPDLLETDRASAMQI